MQSLSNWTPVAVIVGGYLLGIYFQQRAIDSLKDSLNKRIDDLRTDMDKRFSDLYKYLDVRFKTLEDRLTRLEETRLVK